MRSLKKDSVIYKKLNFTAGMNDVMTCDFYIHVSHIALRAGHQIVLG